MDINLLSEEAYNAVITEAENFDDDLVTHFEFLSEVSENENEYLDKAQTLAKDILKFDEEELEDLFYGNAPDKDSLFNTLNNILGNISAVREIPFEKRLSQYSIAGFSFTLSSQTPTSAPLRQIHRSYN
jgi:hypothetical protein